MDKSLIFILVVWLILLVITITLLCLGVKPKDMVGEFLGLCAPLVVALTSFKFKRK